MMRRYTRTTEPEPGDSVLFCSMCGLEVHCTRWADRSRVAEWSEDEVVYWGEVVDMDSRAHLAAEHPWRLWLYERLEWRWLVGNLAP